MFERFYEEVELFVKGMLYKNMDFIFKQYSIESPNYPIFFNHFYPNINTAKMEIENSQN